MGDLTDTIKRLFKCRKVSIDNYVFKLHYHLTVILLVIFSFLITSKQYFGEPIQCDASGKVDESYMNTYCWIYSTFTVKKHLEGEQGKHNVAPGVGMSKVVRVSDKSDEIIKHKYYQWVFVVLILQASFFYLPRYLWKNWEGGRLQAIVKKFELGAMITTTDQALKDSIMQYLMENPYTHNVYTLRYVLCEFYNLLNVVAQTLIVDWFLSGKFYNIGFLIMSLQHDSDPLNNIFPKVAKCSYEKYGPSGTIQLVDAICVLPLNVVNQKLYVFLWFWFIILGFFTLFNLIFRVVTICVKPLRAYLLMVQVRYLNKQKASTVVNKMSWGAWFFLSQMSRNIDPTVFESIVINMERKINAGMRGSYKKLNV